ncbi:MAG: YidC/Oxa1 family insertase periplasmic-domain containing protein, partial [Planctomycetota bacterium]
MEKRLVLFLVLSALILTGHVLVRNILYPPPPRPMAKSGDSTEEEPSKPPRRDEEVPDVEQKPEKQDASTSQETPEGSEGEEDSGPPPEVDAAATPPDIQEEEGPAKWFTLGSFDPAAGYRLLITLCNRGAAVERVELVEREEDGELAYRDLMTTHGYLGLYTHDTKLGCEVKVVGPGTPAERAEPLEQASAEGIQVGDVIDGANGMDIASRADLEGVLKGTQPGDKVALRVYRDGHPSMFSVTVDHWPLQLIQPETPQSPEARLPAGKLVPPPESSPEPHFVPSYLIGVHSIGESKRLRGQKELQGIPSLRRGIWEAVETKKNEIAFSRRVQLPDAMGGGELEFVKRYRLIPADDLKGDMQQDGAKPNEVATGYYLRMELEIQNHGTAPRSVSYIMDGPNGLPVEGWWYTRKIHPSWGSAGARDVMWRVHGNEFRLRSATQIAKQLQDALEEKDVHSAVTSILTNNPTPAQRTLDYIGVDTQYFAAVTRAGTLPGPKAFTCRQAASVPLGELPESGALKKMNTSFQVVSVPQAIEAGESMSDHYHMFLGPKAPKVLEACGLPDIIEYGWFGKIARPLATVLQFFYRIVRNYGLAIVLLTVLVRGAMFPVGRKAARNAQVMQQLAPEIKKIKEKYKNDLQKQGEAQRELWKKHNFNPLSGCWLMFLQLPIFIGLYRCLSVDINLRQAPLIPGIQWCSNLAGPDMAWRWDGIMPGFLANETGWLGPYLNVLPILTIVLFLAQQKMFTPPATDDQTRMQQSMMKYMMIFIGVLFFKVPAGLCVYFIASSMWGIGERKLLPKPELKPAAASKPATQKT